MDNKLIEVTKSTSLVNWAPAFNSPQVTFNRDFWQGLTNDQRATILELAARTHARAQIMYNAGSSKSLEDGRANPDYQVVEPAKSLTDAVQKWVADGVGDMTGVAKNTYGVEDPEGLFASFQPYVTKWGQLVRGMKDPTSEEELTRLFLDNMYNDLDPATYGMK